MAGSSLNSTAAAAAALPYTICIASGLGCGKKGNVEGGKGKTHKNEQTDGVK